MSWISEQEAAKKVNRKPRTLRKLVKSGHLKIDFTAINGRKYQYDLQGIEKLLKENSSIIN